jgi:hypothetical protein
LTTVCIGLLNSTSVPHHLGWPGCDPALVLGPANDSHEHQADRVAALVTGKPVRRPPVEVAGIALHPQVQQATQAARGRGEPIPATVRARLEPVLRADLSQVRLHTDYDADDLTQALDADAFTVGNEIFFGRGQFDPNSLVGLQLLIHELTHVLQQNAGLGSGTVQRWIRVGARGSKEYSQADLLEKFKVDRAQSYSDARKHGLMDDDQIGAFLSPYVTSDQQFFIAQAFDPLEIEIERRRIASTFAPTVDERGIKIQILSTEDNFPKAVTLDEQATKVDLHPAANLVMKARLAVKVPKDQLGQWTIGITQTLISANRRLTLVNPKGIRVVTLTVPGRRNDRRDAGTPPWYDVQRGSWSLVNEFEVNDVLLDDKPGYTFDKARAEAVLNRSGRDVFKTSLILRHNSGNPVRFLFEWRWMVEYRPGREARLTAPPTAQTDGQSLVLDGPRAVDPGQILIDQKSLPLSEPAEFKRLKETATKRFTPGSGMLPQKDYRELYQQFVAHMRAQEVSEAVVVLEQIKQHLNAMGQMGTDYWKSEAQKKAQFDPLYRAVVDLMGELAVDVD